MFCFPVSDLDGSEHFYYIQGKRDGNGVWRYDDNTVINLIMLGNGQPTNRIDEIYLGLNGADGFLVHDWYSSVMLACVCEIIIN